MLALERRTQTYPACLPPTYRLCLSPSIPNPLICETQFSPNLFFLLFLFVSLYFPTQNSSPNPLYCHCSANLSCPEPTPNPYVPFPEGNKGGLASSAEAQRSLRMASSEFSDLPRVGPAAHNERRDGWCGGVHFLIYPIHLNFKLPRGFQQARRA